MGRFFRRLFAYLGMSANMKFDEKADPKVQINQAIQDAKSKHEALRKNAAHIVANGMRLQDKVAQQEKECRDTEAMTASALREAHAAKNAGDMERAEKLFATAQSFASELTSKESALANSQALLEQANIATEGAHAAVQENARKLQEALDERQQLLTQLEQAQMQENINKITESMNELTSAEDAANPTMAHVREQIADRAAKAKGAASINNASLSSQMNEFRATAVKSAGADRLREMELSMNLAPAVTEAPVSETPTLLKAVPETAKASTEPMKK